MKILVVDDSDDSIQLLKLWLKKEGYGTVAAANGAEALEKLQVEEIDLIISDVLMPVMDGFQLCKRVQSDNKLNSIPFVFYTATYTDKNDEKLALQLGAARFVRKPADMNELMAIIKDLCNAGNPCRSDNKPDNQASEDDGVSLKLYNEILVKKLEDKMHLLEKEIAEHKRTEKMLKESEAKYRQVHATSFD